MTTLLFEERGLVCVGSPLGPSRVSDAVGIRASLCVILTLLPSDFRRHDLLCRLHLYSDILLKSVFCRLHLQLLGHFYRKVHYRMVSMARDARSSDLDLIWKIFVLAQARRDT